MNTTKQPCAACNRPIAKARYVTDQQHTFCSACVDSDGLHAQFWPDCKAAWHQPLDHLTDIRFNGETVL